MNISSEVLDSSISNHHIKGGDLFYIGCGIGLSGGMLTLIVIAHYKYYKRKQRIKSSAANHANNANNANNDEIFIKEFLDKHEIVQVI
jgi:hypothetical protein